VLAASDACVAILKDIAMFQTTYPNKVFDYMAAGRPTVLAIGGVIRQVVEASDGGIFAQPGDDDGLAAAIRDLSQNRQRASQMGSRARDYVVKNFNRQDQAESFVALLQRFALAKLLKRFSSRNANKAKRAARSLAIKRIKDLMIVIPALILLAPLYLFLAILIRTKLGSPVLFRQLRPGLGGRPFTMFKFRTMTDERDASGNLLSDAERMTRLGRFLRATSLDELPELINVLRGEMSLVGPRPLLIEYLDRYTPEQMRRHDVRPGITGWAQINGRNALSWGEKFNLDLWYVRHRSLLLDIKILWMTLIKVLKREGISNTGYATMPEFLGSEQANTKGW
jgi:lipopolysaccharide/colanic/teichoic acid biosynthesis glycosyltransferase